MDSVDSADVLIDKKRIHKLEGNFRSSEIRTAGSPTQSKGMVPRIGIIWPLESEIKHQKTL